MWIEMTWVLTLLPTYQLGALTISLNLNVFICKMGVMAEPNTKVYYKG